MDTLLSKFKNLSEKKRHTLHSLIAGFVFFVFLYAFTKLFSVSLCPIKNIFNVSCIGCGLTRAFIAILKLDFKSALEYNPLSIPLFMGIFIYCVIFITDVLSGRENLERLEKLLSKRYMLVLYSLLIAISLKF